MSKWGLKRFIKGATLDSDDRCRECGCRFRFRDGVWWHVGADVERDGHCGCTEPAGTVAVVRNERTG